MSHLSSLRWNLLWQIFYTMTEAETAFRDQLVYQIAMAIARGTLRTRGPVGNP